MANQVNTNCGTTFSALKQTRSQVGECNSLAPATVGTTDTLTSGVLAAAQGLIARLQELSGRLAGEPNGIGGECCSAGSSINDRLVATGFSLQTSHNILTQIASSLGYEV